MAPPANPCLGVEERQGPGQVQALGRPEVQPSWRDPGVTHSDTNKGSALWVSWRAGADIAGCNAPPPPAPHPQQPGC